MLSHPKHQQLRCRGCGSDAPEKRTDSRWWLPGIVIVEFDKRLEPGQIFKLTNPSPAKDLSWVDVGKLREIVTNLLVKPPKSTFAFDPEHGPTAPDYERFVTFYLHPDVNVPEIAKALSKVRGVVRAAGEPRLSPPKQYVPVSEPIGHLHSETLTEAPLLDEPLAVPGGESHGLSVFVGDDDLLNQWYLFRSKADLVLSSGLNGAGVVVADIDWGFNVEHQEFANDRIKFTYNAKKKNSDVSFGPNKWHGTATLGLIGAGDNNAGMLGFAAGADLWAIQGHDDSPYIDNESWGHAIDKVRLEPSGGKPKVILVEASTDADYNVESSYLIREPIKQAIKDGCVVCVTAGNGGGDAGLDEEDEDIPITGSILVGATEYFEDSTPINRGQTNWGSRVVVSAPGSAFSDVTCCICANNTYRNNFGGTSGAGAKVAGAMALLLQAYSQLKHEQIVRAFAKMDRIPPIAGRSIGCFLDLPELITKAGEVLAEDA